MDGMGDASGTSGPTLILKYSLSIKCGAAKFTKYKAPHSARHSAPKAAKARASARRRGCAPAAAEPRRQAAGSRKMRTTPAASRTSRTRAQATGHRRGIAAREAPRYLRRTGAAAAGEGPERLSCGVVAERHADERTQRQACVRHHEPGRRAVTVAAKQRIVAGT
eukprot:scaffold55077_cov66-Phaeocystis_antarctica.AAC.3